MKFAQSIRDTSLIGVACGIGAGRGHSHLGPETLHRRFSSCYADDRIEWRDTLHPMHSHDDDIAVLADLSHRLASVVAAELRTRRFVTVFGGDHSCAIGTWSGVSQAVGGPGRFGLIWIDAHMDSHNPQTSLSGNVHGMPVACLLGHGDSRLIAAGGAGARIDPRHLVLIGVRSWESEEAAFLDRLGVKVYTMNDVRRLGLAAVMAQARARCNEAREGFGISIDLDAMDPRDAPGVGSPVAGGLDSHALLAALADIAADSRLLALEVAELDPVLDVDGRTVKLALSCMGAVVGQEVSMS